MRALDEQGRTRQVRRLDPQGTDGFIWNVRTAGPGTCYRLAVRDTAGNETLSSEICVRGEPADAGSIDLIEQDASGPDATTGDAGGEEDAGEIADGSLPGDAGSVPDAGLNVAAGTGGGLDEADSGCGCRHGRPEGAAGILVLLLLPLGRRRRSC